MWEAIAMGLGLIGLLLKAWSASSPERKEQQRHADDQTIRQAIATGDANTLSRRIDQLRSQARAHYGLSTGVKPDGTDQDRGPGPV